MELGLLRSVIEKWFWVTGGMEKGSFISLFAMTWCMCKVLSKIAYKLRQEGVMIFQLKSQQTTKTEFSMNPRD